MTDQNKHEKSAEVSGSRQQPVVINPYELIGDWVDSKCPKCGAQMLANKVGDEWCSHVECNYGCEDFYELLGL